VKTKVPLVNYNYTNSIEEGEDKEEGEKEEGEKGEGDEKEEEEGGEEEEEEEEPEDPKPALVERNTLLILLTIRCQESFLSSRETPF
jgi:hypothetical protein